MSGNEYFEIVERFLATKPEKDRYRIRDNCYLARGWGEFHDDEIDAIYARCVKEGKVWFELPDVVELYRKRKKELDLLIKSGVIL